jgi:hypothetical protein
MRMDRLPETFGLRFRGPGSAGAAGTKYEPDLYKAFPAFWQAWKYGRWGGEIFFRKYR